MTFVLMLFARLLSANGLPSVVCGDMLVVGQQRCPTPPPPPPQGPTAVIEERDPLTISNGF